MRDRLGAALLGVSLLWACAPEPEPPSRPEAVPSAPSALDADSAARADSSAAASAAWKRRLDLYGGELDTLLQGLGPARLTAAEMDSVVDEIKTGRFYGLHGVVGPSAETRYDFNGDRLSDRYLSTGAGRVHAEGAVYLQHPDGQFALAGTMRLSGFTVCPEGGNSAIVHSVGSHGVWTIVEAETYRVSRRGVESIDREGFQVVDETTQEEVPALAQRADELETRLRRRPDCLRDCDFTGTCFGAQHPRGKVPFQFVIERRADSLRIVLSPSFARDTVQWRLADPTGRERSAGTLIPRGERAEVKLGPARRGKWTVTFDPEAAGEKVSASAGWWDHPDLIR